MSIILQVIGMMGAVLLMCGYYLVSDGKLLPNSRVFQGLNLVGGGCLMVSSFYFSAYGPAILNSFWIAIAGQKLIKLSRDSKTK